MSIALRELGKIIRHYRESEGLTQSDLGNSITPSVSLSCVSRLERGEIAPSSQVIKSICEYLQIPKSDWEQYLTKTGRVWLTEGPIDKKYLPQQIAVSGNIGSGKSTLVSALSIKLGYAQLEESPLGKGYLPDLAQDPKWAFETQLAFLSFKALEIQKLLNRGLRVIVDRSLSEDIDIFATLWYEKEAISDRAYATYKALAEHFLDILPAPDLILYSKCTPETCFQRVQVRNRGDALHSQEHVQDIQYRYEEWIKNYTNCPVAVVDSEAYDYRDQNVINEISDEIVELFRIEKSHMFQGNLFENEKVPSSKIPEILSIKEGEFRTESIDDTKYRNIFLAKPTAYIAAPFTSVATDNINAHEQDFELFPSDSVHGVIGRGKYRRTLTGMEKTLATFGISSWIPHRDTNVWGRRMMTSEQVAIECSSQVYECDFMVCILGTSVGAHYELGLAKGLGKPAIVVSCSEIPGSFFGEGITLATWPDTLSISVEKLSEIPRELNTNVVKRFLSQYFQLDLH